MNAPVIAAPPSLAPPATATDESFSQSIFPLTGSGTSGTSGISLVFAETAVLPVGSVCVLAPI